MRARLCGGVKREASWKCRASIPVPVACEATALPFELRTLQKKRKRRRRKREQRKQFSTTSPNQKASWIDAQRPSFAQLVALAPEIGFLDKDAILSGIDPARRSRGSGVRPIPPRMTWRVFNLYRWVSLLGIDAG